MNAKLMVIVVALSGSACSSGPDPGVVKTMVQPLTLTPSIQKSIPPLMLQGGSILDSMSLPEGLGSAQQALDGTTMCGAPMVDACMGLTGNSSLLCTLKQRLFCPGPTELLKILDALDGRIVGIRNSRTPNKEDQPCLQAPLSDHTADLAFPGSQTFTELLSCKDGGVNLGFAHQETDDSWYYRNGLGAGGWAFHADVMANVAGYLWVGGDTEGSTVMLRIKKTAPSTLEITGGGTGVGFCALHWRSDAGNVWIRMNAEGPGGCDSDQSGTADAADYSEICLAYTATTLNQADASACAALKSGTELPLLGRADYTSPGGTKTLAAASAGPGSPVTIDLSTLKSLTTKAGDVTGLIEWVK